MGQSESGKKAPEEAAAGAEAKAGEPAAAAPAGASAADILQALCKHADEVGHHVEKKQLMEYLAMDESGKVLDQAKHDEAKAKLAGAVDEKGNIVNKEKFIADCDLVAGGKAAKPKKEPKAKKEAKPPIGLGTKVCVRNLPEDTTPEKFSAMFESFGKISKVDLKTKDGGKSKGFGFLAFETADEAAKAMADMNDKMVDGKKLAVTLAFESQEKGGEKGKGGKDGKGKGAGKDGGKGVEKGKGKGKGKKGDLANPSSQAAQYQQYQAQVQSWYALQMHAAMMAQWQAAQMQGYYGQGGYGLGMPAGASPKAGGAAAVGDSKEYTGIIKRITQRNGYGFISCPELKGRWKDEKNPDGRDIYIASDLIPETSTEPGSQVKFTLTFNAKGHPQASTCSAIA